MKAKLLTFVTLAAMFVGGLAWTNTADARPWRGYYAGPPARFYYRSGYAYPYRAYPYGAYPYRYAGPYRSYGWYGPTYYGTRFYGPRYYPSYYRSGVYIGAGPAGVYIR